MDLLTVNGGSGSNTYTVTATAGYQATTVNTGTGSDTVNVEATSAGRPLTINEQGTAADTVNLSPTAKNLDNLQGDVTINGNGGGGKLYVHDEANAANAEWTMTAGSVQRTGSATVEFTWLAVLTVCGGSGANTYDVIDTGASTLTTINGGNGDAGNGGNVYNIDHTTDPLTVNGGTGGETFIVTPNTQNLGQIAGKLTFNSQGSGNDKIVIYDNPELDNYTVKDTGITSASHPGFNFSYTGQSPQGGFDGTIVLYTDPDSTVTDNTGSATLKINP
jgi:hypothetical protein